MSKPESSFISGVHKHLPVYAAVVPDLSALQLRGRWAEGREARHDMVEHWFHLANAREAA